MFNINNRIFEIKRNKNKYLSIRYVSGLTTTSITREYLRISDSNTVKYIKFRSINEIVNTYCSSKFGYNSIYIEDDKINELLLNLKSQKIQKGNLLNYDIIFLLTCKDCFINDHFKDIQKSIERRDFIFSVFTNELSEVSQKIFPFYSIWNSSSHKIKKKIREIVWKSMKKNKLCHRNKFIDDKDISFSDYSKYMFFRGCSPILVTSPNAVFSQYRDVSFVFN